MGSAESSSTLRDGRTRTGRSEPSPPRQGEVTGQSSRTGEPTLRDLSEALIAVYGTDFGIHSPTLISRFTDMARQAAS